MLLLSACGFRPLYAERDAVYDSRLAAVRIEQIPDRIGQLLTIQLRDNFNPSGQRVNSLYTLKVTLSTERREIGIRKDATATRFQFDVIAGYTLIRIADRAIVLSASARATNAFDIIDNDYSTVVAEKSAQTRALREIGNEIQTRVTLLLQGETS